MSARRFVFVLDGAYFDDGGVPKEGLLGKTQEEWLQANPDMLPGIDWSIMLAALNLKHQVEAVKNTRKIRKKDMVHNSWQPKIDVDAETYEVRADGELLVCEPAKVLPMAQRYFLF